MYGLPLVRRLIPCPLCINWMTNRHSKKRSVSLEFPSTLPANFHMSQTVRPHNFTLPECAATAMRFSTISCPSHPDRVVSISLLIPDLLMADLPRQLLVEETQFNFDPRESQKIGGGGSGEVYRGSYRNETVAVKMFHSTGQTGSLLDSGLGNTGPSPGSRTLSGSCYRSHLSEGSSGRRSDVYTANIERDMEEELERTKVVKAFWDLRQEVAVLCRLNHPCVVRLLAVSLHPLCFVLELAPYGSLATVLDELSTKREAQENEGSQVASSREAILGRELSYNIAFQIVSALWYLHDCDIIYRDLKADNILVWSLVESALLNVKLSDYGISCFATPQGVAGEEGTPGYQAPEIRTGVGYDEKVDIFSFAIFLFELLTGCRPFSDYRNVVDIKKAIRRGVRPSPQLELDSQLPRLERLMRSCWHQLPERRPSAGEILTEMEDPAFLCQCRLLPTTDENLLEKVTAIYALSNVASGNPKVPAAMDGPSTEIASSFILIWSRERNDRYYSLINCETGVFHTQGQNCDGHRVLCMTRVDNRTWLGTEGCTVEVFGRTSWRNPSTLWSYTTKAPVLALLTEYVPADDDSPEKAEQEGGPRVRSVFASLANGTLIVFTPKTRLARRFSHADVTLETKDEDTRLKKESDKWSNFQVVNLGQSGMPAKCMVLVFDNKELWVGCGNKIVIVDTNTLAILDEIAVYQTQRTHVRIMVTDGLRVWCADRRSSKILQWEVNSRQLTNIFDCDVNNPVGQVLNTNIMESRRFTSRKSDDERSSRRDRTVSDPPDMYEPSFTESMFKEAMARSMNEEGERTDSVGRDDSLPRQSDSDFGRNATGNDLHENFGNMDSKQVQRLSCFRSHSAEADSDESGISLSRSKNTMRSSSVSIQAGTTPRESYAQTEDLQTDEDCASVTSENVSILVEKTATFDTYQNNGKEEIESSSDATFKHGTRDTLSVKTKPEIIIEIQKQTGDNNVEVEKETDNVTREPADEREGAEFELVDREETRQAEKSISPTCASMTSLIQPFNSPSRAPSLMSSTRRKSQRRQEKDEGSKSPPSKPWTARPRLRILAGTINRVTALLLVNGTLWIGRGVGDVLTVNVNSVNNDVPLGHVFAQLESDNLLGYENGQVDEIVSSGTDKVVCLRRLETPRGRADAADRGLERYQLVVWEAWGDAEFRKFSSRLEEFNSLIQ